MPNGVAKTGNTKEQNRKRNHMKDESELIERLYTKIKELEYDLAIKNKTIKTYKNDEKNGHRTRNTFNKSMHALRKACIKTSSTTLIIFCM